MFYNVNICFNAFYSDFYNGILPLFNILLCTGIVSRCRVNVDFHLPFVLSRRGDEAYCKLHVYSPND
jgi:hypothetical protein